MRLSDANQDIIRRTVRELFGPEARVLSFGSRTNDAARGGDIDLLVDSPAPIADARRKALILTARLQRRLGDQRIDVLCVDPTTQRSPVYEEALRLGRPV